jgi:2',3'-cyclic-nucleotide 2'-phosphodiesterase (5'-nucleotidase family)
MLDSEIHGDKTKMRVTRVTFAPPHILRPVLLLLMFAVLARAGVGQSKPIEPCSATPTPAASTVKTSANAPDIPARPTTHASETLIDKSIPDDPAVDKMLAPYSEKVRALTVVIGSLEGELTKTGVGGGSMGNFVADGIRASASAKLGRPVVLAVTNSGGLRKNAILPGELRTSDIFELLPFENALIEVELTGTQVLKLLQIVTSARDAQSGASIQYRWNAENKPEFISARLIDANGQEQAINPQTTYKVITIDYLLKLGSGNYAILQESKSVTELGLTIRDALMGYVKAETAAGHPIKARLDNRFVQVGPGPTKSETK